MSNGMTRPMLQVVVQRATTQCVIAERAVIGGDPRGADARIWAVSGLIVRAARASAWLHVAAEALRRGFAAFIWFWNIPVLGADETQESHYLRTGYLN
jgi:hypothetical protein